MLDSIIRDKIILETYDKILRKKFFEADNLDLPKLVAIYHDYNINTEKMKQVTKETRDFTNFTPKPSDNIVRKCWRCNQQHPRGKCPAWGSKCTKCGDINHFSHCCKGYNFKMNKVNKNLLDPVQQMKFTSKNNDKWNNQADSEVKINDSINKMAFPDVPKTNLNHNTMNYSTPKNTQYNHSHVKLIRPDGTVSDLIPNRGENVQPKQMKTPSEGTSQERFHASKSFFESRGLHYTNCSTQKCSKIHKKKPDDPCVLS
ncbi:hypothetical protein ALC62_09020 [Cyphomyrmex costatus]|uniref:Uncharacterized protein n=2 Tax=Cyphomyrmex costatus TaxID=456900 RepID=A0A151IG64_9HYME|nr:hypothetical protein ALC62_09020 [Cyphomyrmex costatus]